MRATLICVIAAVLVQAHVHGQNLCPPDNLSCPRDDPVNDPLECYQTAELCDGFDFCGDGSDEGGVAALDCKFRCLQHALYYTERTAYRMS